MVPAARADLRPAVAAGSEPRPAARRRWVGVLNNPHHRKEPVGIMQNIPVNPHHDKRWWILGVIGVAQLMIFLDITVVTIALPSAQEDLGFADNIRQWVITSYALAFG